MFEYRHGLHELLCRAGQKDEEAFTQIYQAIHRVALVAILAEVSSLDEAEAEAVFNRAMFKVWDRAGTYQGRPGPDPDLTAWAWIRTTILRTAQDASRMHRRRSVAEVLESDMLPEDEQEDISDLSPIDRLAPGEVSPADQVQTSPSALLEAHEGLIEYLDELDERERRVFQMLAEGTSQAEAAQTLGVSASRLSQIVRSMRDKAGRLTR